MIQALIGAAIVSREVWEANWAGAPGELTDERIAVENFFNSVRRQGSLAAELALDPHTAEELHEQCEGAIERLPIWLEAQVYGPPKTSEEEFLENVAELVRVHREAIERVVEEQIAEPREIEVVLAAAPPPGPEAPDLAGALGRAVSANARALVLIARDLDERQLG